MKREINYREQNCFLPVNMFTSALKLGALTWGSVGTDSIVKPASSGHSERHFLALKHWLHSSAPEVAACFTVEEALNQNRTFKSHTNRNRCSLTAHITAARLCLNAFVKGNKKGTRAHDFLKRHKKKAFPSFFDNIHSDKR